MTAEPAARAPRSRGLRGKWPSYLGGGRLRTENGLLKQEVARRRPGGSLRRVSVFMPAALLLMVAVRRKSQLIDTVTNSEFEEVCNIVCDWSIPRSSFAAPL